MGLKDRHQAIIRKRLTSALQSSPNLRRVVRVVIDHNHPVFRLTQSLEPPSRPRKLIQSRRHRQGLDSQNFDGGGGPERIQDIVPTRDVQCDPLWLLFRSCVAQQAKDRAVLIRCPDAAGEAVAGRHSIAIAEDFLRDLRFDFRTDYRVMRLGEKSLERGVEVLLGAVEIQMIGLDIENQRDRRTEPVETAIGFAGFDDDDVRVARKGVALDHREVTADQNRRV